MEELNKQQLILLTLLVSFVTSIATGIITVSLLDQAPTAVTQTINRVVERTVETVVPASVTPAKEKVTTTVIVKEEDLVIDSIAKNSDSVVRVFSKATVDTPATFYGLGLVISGDGSVLVNGSDFAKNSSYYGVFNNGVSNDFNFATSTIGGDFVVLSTIPNAVTASSTKQTFKSVTFGDSDAVKLGQSVTALGGKDKNEVAFGRVSGLNDDKSGNLYTIESDASGKSQFSGSILLNLSGEVIGFKTPELENLAKNTYIAGNIVKSAISGLNAPEKSL